MRIKFLQLNIFMGKKLPTLLSYIHKEQFDILSLQEVSGGDASFENVNCFQEIANLGYEGELLVTWRFKGQKQGFFGQAIFFKKDFTLLGREDTWLRPYTDLEDLVHSDPQNFPKAVLKLKLEKEGKRLHILSAHLAWSPDSKDSPEKLRQGKLFYEYMKTVTPPFILSGDFNVDYSSQIITWINTLGRNLAIENNITNTLNPRIHKAQELFPHGLPVDYIYTSNDIKIEEFYVIEEPDLSDHLGLCLVFSM